VSCYHIARDGRPALQEKKSGPEPTARPVYPKKTSGSFPKFLKPRCHWKSVVLRAPAETPGGIGWALGRVAGKSASGTAVEVGGDLTGRTIEGSAKKPRKGNNPQTKKGDRAGEIYVRDGCSRAGEKSAGKGGAGFSKKPGLISLELRDFPETLGGGRAENGFCPILSSAHVECQTSPVRPDLSALSSGGSARFGLGTVDKRPWRKAFSSCWKPRRSGPRALLREYGHWIYSAGVRRLLIRVFLENKTSERGFWRMPHEISLLAIAGGSVHRKTSGQAAGIDTWDYYP